MPRARKTVSNKKTTANRRVAKTPTSKKTAVIPKKKKQPAVTAEKKEKPIDDKKAKEEKQSAVTAEKKEKPIDNKKAKEEPIDNEKQIPPDEKDEETTTSSTSTKEPEPEPAPPQTASEKLKKLEEALADYVKLGRQLVKEVRAARRLHENELKEARKQQKGGRRQRDPTKKRKLTGFAQPGPISKDLANFLDIDPDREIARTEVTKLITAYIKKHDLQNPEDRRQIICDDKLMALLNVGPSDDVNFFNLQTLMKPHYLKKTKNELKK